jgi:hypothetical protein
MRMSSAYGAAAAVSQTAARGSHGVAVPMPRVQAAISSPASRLGTLRYPSVAAVSVGGMRRSEPRTGTVTVSAQSCQALRCRQWRFTHTQLAADEECQLYQPPHRRHAAA